MIGAQEEKVAYDHLEWRKSIFLGILAYTHTSKSHFGHLKEEIVLYVFDGIRTNYKFATKEATIKTTSS